MAVLMKGLDAAPHLKQPDLLPADHQPCLCGIEPVYIGQALLFVGQVVGEVFNLEQVAKQVRRPSYSAAASSLRRLEGVSGYQMGHGLTCQSRQR